MFAGIGGLERGLRQSGHRTHRKKDLDLVLCTRGSHEADFADQTFIGLVGKYGIELTAAERKALSKLPPLERVPVGSVHVALEAKACMTEHVKALPRFYDELNSSHQAIHGASDLSIAAGFTMINRSEVFRSPDRNRVDLSVHPVRETKHRQPDVCKRTVDKVRELPRRSKLGDEGFDAIGIVVVDCANDGSAVRLVKGAPAPPPNDLFHYESMVRRIAQWYEHRFANA